MIIQAISLLDDLDKELNTYAMRVKEWYGWHFPEMSKILNDNLAYARVIQKMGMRSNATNADLSEILPEEIEGAVKAAADISMGTEITTEDLDNIQALAEQVVSFTEYRSQLSNYLSARMQAIAPNLTSLVGDLVGARLIAHSGSLMNLAKSPASTIQILGAEKALFRALKTKHDTPKYGLIYHTSLVGQATGKNKGKMARMLATKSALGLRVDALADWSAEGQDDAEDERMMIGNLGREKLERRLASLEGKPLRPRGVAIAPNGMSHQPGKWEIKEARKYNHDADGLIGDEPAAVAPPSKTIKTNGTKLIEEISDEPPAKKKAAEVANGIRPIQDVVKDALDDVDEESDDDEEESDEPMTEAPEPRINGKQAVDSKGDQTVEDADDDGKSVTLSLVSDDTPDSPASPTQQEINWQSRIEGNTKVAKKARKKERHARKIILSEERSAKRQKERARLARRLDRKNRRQKKAEQEERRENQQDSNVSELAALAGLSVVRYQRKLARGEIKFDKSGKPISISKKDIKKAKKAAEKAEPAANGESTEVKKRKREADHDGVNDRAEKKKKKKEKSLKA